MSQEKTLRKKIREMIRGEINEESLVGKWFRKLAKNVETREFDRLMKTRDPLLQQRLDKINKDVSKDLLKKVDKAIKDYKKAKKSK
tara:strand:+ start:196 stop:453 length:258 start_codon:yes stop_codon:yes gene_type:complete